MRLRNVKGADEKILANPYTIQSDCTSGETLKGLWHKNVFHNDNPIHIEIGMGKGQFISQLALNNPDINYIGIEKYSSVLIRAIEKREALELNNLMFMRMNAEEITDYFAKDEVQRIYLNFSDPWPKDRHSKRRLTSLQFLERYEQIMDKNAILQFKTDNRPLFDFSLQQIEERGWKLLMHDFDLHKDGPAADNIMTEYEQKFFSEGKPICKLQCKPS